MSKEIEIVVLEGGHVRMPKYDIPHKYTEYEFTDISDESIIASRIGTAEIVTVVRAVVTASVIAKCPNLKLIAVFAAGTDSVDLEACKAKGITVCNIPFAATETVAEHALGLYFSVRRHTVRAHEFTVNSQWPVLKSGMKAFDTKAGLPRTCKNEVIGIIGGGRLGNLLGKLAKALGMKVLMAERKGVPDGSVRSGRTSFTDVIVQSSVIALTCPLDPSTLNTLSVPEFKAMKQDSIIINVARGGVVNENALAQALREGWIAGAATDVFVVEPAGKGNSILIREYDNIPNLTLSPHTAWLSGSTIADLQSTLKENIENWVAGKPRNLVV